MDANEQLLAAAQSGDVVAARAALDSGADKECEDAEVCCRWRRCALSAPCARAHTSPPHRAQYGQTPLAWAAEKGHVGVVQLLVERGCDIETKDNVR
jgi:hypothetical protein